MDIYDNPNNSVVRAVDINSTFSTRLKHFTASKTNQHCYHSRRLTNTTGQIQFYDQ